MSPVTWGKKQRSLHNSKQGVRRKVRVRKSRWAWKVLVVVVAEEGQGFGVYPHCCLDEVLKEIFNSVPPTNLLNPPGLSNTPLHHPSPCLVQRRSPGASGLCQKDWLDVFYVQHCWLSWGPLWLFIYLFHSSRVIVPICYTKALSSPWESRRFYCRAPVCLWNSLSLSFKVKLRFFFFFFNFLKSALLSCAHSTTLSVLFCCSGSPPPRLPHLPHTDSDWHAPPWGAVPLRTARAARHARVSHLYFFLTKTEYVEIWKTKTDLSQALFWWETTISITFFITFFPLWGVQDQKAVAGENTLTSRLYMLCLLFPLDSALLPLCAWDLLVVFVQRSSRVVQM